MINLSRRTSLLSALTCLTVLFVTAQIIFFAIHYNIAGLLDIISANTLGKQLIHPVIILPLLVFLLVQIGSYALFVWWIKSLTENYFWGIFLWCMGCIAILSLNNFYFPDSFFSFITDATLNKILLFGSSSILLFATVRACWKYPRVRYCFMFLSTGWALLASYEQYISHTANQYADKQPNVILIGLDSLRPDFTGYFGNSTTKTPNIDAFLQHANTFTHAYTPLARTFPAWVSILTGQYPKHTAARNNLTQTAHPITLAMILQNQGYETIYATDEKRFSNITKSFGFNQIIGPAMGVNDFILGNLTDFPLTNLLVNTYLGKWLLPFNYANRAAAVTYQPNQFIKMLQSTLAQRPNKPLFLAVHLCTSHWPYTWAHDQQSKNLSLAGRYQSSVEEVDRQLGKLLKILQQDNLLKNSLVILLSDHGTALGLPGDRLTALANYRGDREKIKWLPMFYLNTPDATPRLDTAYGQGTDVLSMQQHRVLLAIKTNNVAKTDTPVSLIDIMPTVLDFLHLPYHIKLDGISLLQPARTRALWFESGYSIAEIETASIVANQVLQKSIGIYQIDPSTGLLTVLPELEKSYLKTKQRAVLHGQWLLAKMPGSIGHKLLKAADHHWQFASIQLPSYFVLANLQTYQWTIGLSSPLAKQAPVDELRRWFDILYGTDN